MKTKKVINLAIFIIMGLLTISSCSKNNDCTEQTWYQDSDGDDFGNPNNSRVSCDQPNGYISDNTDFDDTNASAYPGAIETCNDGIDNDGDGFIDCVDFDCIGNVSCPEICDDGIDNDGDGFIDCDDFDCIGDPAC